MRIANTDLRELQRAALDPTPVGGLTHNFYRYPARFSPTFARTAIETFTEPGDFILDPFAGGGTTLVEALALGRPGVGVDISPLAGFVARAKTTFLSRQQRIALGDWVEEIPDRLNLRNRSRVPADWVEAGYQRNLKSRAHWPTRKALELGLEYSEDLATPAERRLARCALLRTGQWALDCKRHPLTATEFRQKMSENVWQMLSGLQELHTESRRSWISVRTGGFRKTLSIVARTDGVAGHECFFRRPAPRLILTSPPYPGVHVVYHRWQVGGRRETPAPFWVAGKLDGRPERHYALGERREPGLETYFANLKLSFQALAKISDGSTLVVQLVAFSDPSWQLPRFLETLYDAGFREVEGSAYPARESRFSRSVPNRKWYATQLGGIPASEEVLLIHRLR